MSHVDPTFTVQPTADLQPARLVLTSTAGSSVLDGVWWPHSWSLHREVPFLDVAVHDATRARIARLSYTVGTWDEDASKIWTPLGMVKVGWFITSAHPTDVDLSLPDNRRVVLHVIAPSTSAREAHARLQVAEDSRAQGSPSMVRPDADRDLADGSASIRRVRMIADPAARDALLQSLLTAGVDATVTEVATPVLRQVGEGWQSGELGVLHEHFASSAFRGVLGEFRMPVQGERVPLFLAGEGRSPCRPRPRASPCCRAT